MKHVLHKCVIILCVVSLSAAFANSFSRQGDVQSRPTINPDNVPQYIPASRQNDVLFVEDICGSFGPATHPDPLWDSLLTELVGTGNYGWFTTPDDSADGPDLATMELYDLVVWNCYDYWFQGPTALTAQDQLNISDLLFNGGKLWLIGQDILWSGVPMPWMNTHFHLASANQDYNYGADSTPVQGLVEITGYSMTVIPDYASNPLYHDELIPDTVFAHGVLEDTDSNKIVGIFYPGQMDWQSAFWAIDLRDSLWFYWGEIIGMVGGMFDAFGLTGIDEFGAEPVRHFNLNISPDPFVRTTTISFEVPNASHVRLDIFNKAGQYVTNLMDSRQNAGTHHVNWNRRDTRNMEVPNGVYFVRLTCDDVSSTANIVVTK
jgi:hypothetical protein